MASGGSDDILGQFAEFLKAKNEAEGGPADYGVNASTTDPDGSTHSIQGVPLSRLGAEFLAKFGIEGEGGKGEAGKGDAGKGDGGQGGKGDGDGKGAGVSPLRAFFPQGGKGQQAS
jgi:hypothetical protein